MSLLAFTLALLSRIILPHCGDAAYSRSWTNQPAITSPPPVYADGGSGADPWGG